MTTVNVVDVVDVEVSVVLVVVAAVVEVLLELDVVVGSSNARILVPPSSSAGAKDRTSAASALRRALNRALNPPWLRRGRFIAAR